MSDRIFYIRNTGKTDIVYREFWFSNLELFGLRLETYDVEVDNVGLTLEMARKNLEIIQSKFPDNKFEIYEKSL